MLHLHCAVVTSYSIFAFVLYESLWTRTTHDFYLQNHKLANQPCTGLYIHNVRTFSRYVYISGCPQPPLSIKILYDTGWVIFPDIIITIFYVSTQTQKRNLAIKKWSIFFLIYITGAIYEKYLLFFFSEN